MLSNDRNAFSSGFIQVAAAAAEMKEDEEFSESCSLFNTESLLDSSPAVASASGTGTRGIQSSLQNSLAGSRDNAACVSSTVPVRGAGGASAKGKNTSRTGKNQDNSIFFSAE
jgi:hypothetical protein